MLDEFMNAIIATGHYKGRTIWVDYEPQEDSILVTRYSSENDFSDEVKDDLREIERTYEVPDGR